MRKLLTLLLICTTSQAYTQDTAQMLRQIDSVVFSINHSQLFFTKQDSSVQDIPALKLYIKSYLTAVTNGSELKKYVQRGYSKSEEKGVQKNLVTGTAFYFDNGQLIKVEEYVGNETREQKMQWYYADGKPLRYILIPAMTAKEEAKMKPRHEELIPLADGVRKTVESKLPKM